MSARVILFRCLAVGVLSLCPHGLCRGQVEPSRACADVNSDDSIDIADGIHVLRWLYLGGPELTCSHWISSCGDVTGDSTIDMSDAVSILGWLFIGNAEIDCTYACDNAEARNMEGFTFVECNAQGYPEYTHDQTGVVFVFLPGGNFLMGSPNDESYHEDAEGPLHWVALSPFLVAKYETTQAQWRQVMGSNPSHFQPGVVPSEVDSDNLPVEQVSWDDVQEFNAATGLTLPTEAQWEYACRGGTQTAFSFGSGEECSDWYCRACNRDAFMWYCANAEDRTHEVGTRTANPFGLYDTHGNVYEWCQDVYSESFYSSATATAPDPVCTGGSVYRVRRGGRWGNSAWRCRSANRYWLEPQNSYDGLGFRPAFYPLPD